MALDLIDEVHFRHRKTAVAISRCKAARVSDNRCNNRSLSCHPCSEIRHSDHSSYKIYSLRGGGGRQVTKNCYAQEIDRRANVIDSYLGSATGRMPQRVKQRACEKAMQTCRIYKYRSNTCQVRGRNGGGNGSRRLVQTFHFRDRKTAEARRKCQVYRTNVRECGMRSYSCTPCSVESHTDHSEFSLFKIR